VAGDSVYVDCDVEEPNGYLFFKPQELTKEEVNVTIPDFNKSLCDGCKKCVDFCKFNALAYINQELLIFDKVCHSCGGCFLICPQKALTEKEKTIGQIQKGTSEYVQVMTGILNTEEVSGIPIIKRLLEDLPDDREFVFIDCPPGSSCVVMESIKEADYCILVAEPTLFGVHNLNMVYELVTLFKKPYGVVLNKCLEEENPSEIFCREKSMRILGKIPYDNDLGTLNSNAIISVRISSKYKKLFSALLQTVAKEVANETATNP
jgi:MinD superfamily P-loop ATPase